MFDIVWVGYVVAGVVAGLSSGTLGTGGGIVATPLIRLLGVSPYIAVGTTVPAMLPSALTGAVTYMRAGMVNVRAALWAGLAGSVASFFGARATRLVSGHLLMFLTALVLLTLALRLAPSKSREPKADSEKHSALGFLAVGAVAGFFSGLLGIGGGFVMVPLFIRAFGFSLKMALGTSLACIVLIIPANLIGQVQAGNINWAVAGLLTLGVVPGAMMGALGALRAREEVLRKVVAVGLTVLALTYGALELVAFSASR